MVLKDAGVHSAQDTGKKLCDVCLSYDGSTLFVYNFGLGCIACGKRVREMLDLEHFINR